MATEAPHTSLAYPDAPEQIADPILQKLWELTSPLLGGERLAAENPVKADSRGMVVNGKFDLFLDEIKKTLAP